MDTSHSPASSVGIIGVITAVHVAGGGVDAFPSDITYDILVLDTNMEYQGVVPYNRKPNTRRVIPALVGTPFTGAMFPRSDTTIADYTINWTIQEHDAVESCDPPPPPGG